MAEYDVGGLGSVGGGNTDSVLNTHLALIQTLTTRVNNPERLFGSADAKQQDLIEMCSLFQKFVETYGANAHQ